MKNLEPQSFAGQPYDVGIYKDRRLLITQNGVRVGSQVIFTLKPVLAFAIAHNKRTGDTFLAQDLKTKMTEFDLDKFPKGLVVTLKKTGGGGKYVFTGSKM